MPRLVTLLLLSAPLSIACASTTTTTSSGVDTPEQPSRTDHAPHSQPGVDADEQIANAAYQVQINKLRENFEAASDMVFMEEFVMIGFSDEGPTYGTLVDAIWPEIESLGLTKAEVHDRLKGGLVERKMKKMHEEGKLPPWMAKGAKTTASLRRDSTSPEGCTRFLQLARKAHQACRHVGAVAVALNVLKKCEPNVGWTAEDGPLQTFDPETYILRCAEKNKTWAERSLECGRALNNPDASTTCWDAKLRSDTR